MESLHGHPWRGRCAAAGAAAVLIGGGFLGGLAQAGGEPDDVGTPGEDGQDVTCTAYLPPMNAPICNVVGEDGADGATGVGR